ncbi:hypothetical protein FGG08_004276 [Glutinoglossum americanum]|uniref:C2H2-type domain-containing protein n=1 Tax=Glutinoglossum americanum TaxID=1670608 RepID=A0A9P8KZQ1_9PEZI|nr:hypothetical protein FGG08_004276 [Glutinoglossum americanum]
MFHLGKKKALSVLKRPLSPSGSDSTEDQFSEWGASYPDSPGTCQEKFRCALVDCSMAFREARQMAQHLSSAHSIPSADICPCQEHHIVGRHAMNQAAQRNAFTASVCRLIRSFQKHSGSGSLKGMTSRKGNLAATSSSTPYEPEVPEFGLVELSADREPGELVGSRVPYELEAEGPSLNGYPAEAYYAPMGVDADEVQEPLSPVSPVSPGSFRSSLSGHSGAPSFLRHDDHAYGGSVADTDEDTVATGCGATTTSRYTSPLLDVYREVYPDSVGAVPAQSSGRGALPNTLLETNLSPMDVPFHITPLVVIIQQVRTGIIRDLIDNTLNGLQVMRSAIQHNPSLSFSNFIMSYTSPRPLLERCLRALMRARLEYPTTEEEYFFLAYLACMTFPIVKGYCLPRREGELSGNVKTAMESCVGYFGLMDHVDAIGRRLEGQPDDRIVPDRGLSVPYIKRTILLALPSEPGTEEFIPFATGAVDTLDGERQHDIYDVVVRLIHVGYTNGPRSHYFDYARAVILTSYTALVGVVGPEPFSHNFDSVIRDLIDTLEEPTTATQTTSQPQAMLSAYPPVAPQPMPQHRVLILSRRPVTPPSPQHNTYTAKISPLSPESGYFSLTSTPPNTPGEQRQRDIASPFAHRRIAYTATADSTLPAHHPHLIHRRPLPNYSTSPLEPAPSDLGLGGLALNDPVYGDPALRDPTSTLSPNLLRCGLCSYAPKPNPNIDFMKSNLRRHERTKHGQYCVFDCPYCESEVGSGGRGDNFQHHLEKFHGVERKWSAVEKNKFRRMGEGGEGRGRGRKRRKV